MELLKLRICATLYSMSLRFDVNKWLLHCLPPILRRQVIYALFSCCIQPIKNIYARYADYVSLVNAKVAARSYAGALAAWLNSVFYLPDNTIYIEDSISDTHYLFYRNETPDAKYLFTQAEGNAPYLNFQTQELFKGFYIHIPATLNTPENLLIIEQWVGYYKIAGVKYKIISDE